MAELAIPVHGVLPATDTPLSGIGQIGYGIAAGSTGANEDWLVQGGTQGGIWTLTTPANTWARRSDLDAPSEFANMPSVRVREGDQGIAGSVWYYSGPSSPSIGSDALTFTLHGRGYPAEAGLGLEPNYPYIQIPQRTIDTRYLIGATTKFDDFGLLEYADIWPGAMRHIRGLIPQPSGTGVVATFGDAYIPSEDGIVASDPNGVFEYHVPSMPTLAANTLYYAYFYSLDSTVRGDVEISSTIPDYMSILGNQYPSFPGRQKLGDESRRYIGPAGRTNASGVLYRFSILPKGDNTLEVTYLEDTTASPFRAVNGGTATTNQTVNLGPSGLKLVPLGCRDVWARVGVNATSGVWIDNSEMGTSPAAASGQHNIQAVERAQHVWISLDSNQSFRWANGSAGGATNIDIKKYIDRR